MDNDIAPNHMAVAWISAKVQKPWQMKMYTHSFLEESIIILKQWFIKTDNGQ